MPLGLHSSCKSRLVAALTEALGHIKVRSGQFIDYQSAWTALQKVEIVLPASKELKERLSLYLDDEPLTHFMMDVLDDELRDRSVDHSNSLEVLTEIENYSDARAVAQRLVEKFESLPNSYTFSIALPESLSDLLDGDAEELKISSSLRIVRATTSFVELFPPDQAPVLPVAKPMGLLSLGSFYGMDDKVYWSEGKLYLQIFAQGFVGVYGTSNTKLEVLRRLRAFLGLGLALRVWTSSSLPSWDAAGYFAIHEGDKAGTQQLQRRFNLSDALSKAMASLRLAKNESWTDDTRRGWINRALSEISSVFRNESAAESIILAGQWFFDSNQGDDQLLRYVQSIVVLESLLGDKVQNKDIGLSELLRNRCAYLISNSQEERVDMMRDFDEIYKVRSQIVHRGKHRLSGREQELFFKLRWLCHRVIKKEVELLRGNKTPTAVIAELLSKQ